MTIVDLPATGTDAAIGIQPGKAYTHAFDFGSDAPVTINGVAFEQGPSDNVLGEAFVGVSGQGYGYLIGDTRSSARVYVHGGNDPSGQADGDSAEMLRDMLFPSSADVDHGVTVTLSDLKSGLRYSVRYYYRSWDSGRPITVRADGESNGVFADSIDIDIDQGGAHYLDYAFEADDSDVTIEFITTVDNQGVHLYGITCEELGPRGAASCPSPVHEAKDVSRDALLTWTPGESAGTHDVYFGTTFDDVNDGVVLVGPGQDANSFDPGRLEFGQTYFWRVDEVSVPPESELFKGDVWTFTVEPFARPISADRITATASSSLNADSGPQKTVDGSGLNASDQHDTLDMNMWLSAVGQEPPVWIQYEFDRVYELHQMWVWNSNNALEPLVGLGIKTATMEYSTDGATWTTLANVSEFARGPGAADYAANTTVDFGGVAAKFVKITITSNWGGLGQYALSEVRFFTIPVVAREPHPDTGATGVPLDTTLSWRPGREADVHQVHFGTDSNAVASGAALLDAVPASTYSVGSLDLGTTYYWKIDEVNEAETPSVWEGLVWDFTTKEYIVVDDFEAYTDTAGEEMFTTWADGYGDSSNGSQVGHDMPPYAEQAVYHSGGQSMPLYYGKEGVGHSETTRTFDTAQDWSRSGLKTLSIAFHGMPGNTGQLYVKINDVTINYDQAATDIANPSWLLWQIDLTSISGVGNVTQLSIGVEGSVDQGLVYIDDIALYGQSPATVTPVVPDSANLVARYAFNGDLQDAQGTHHGAMASGSPVFASGYQGQALDLGGAQEVIVPYAVDLGMSSFTVSAWINVDNLDATRGILSTRFGSENTFDLKVEPDKLHGDLGDGSSWIHTALDLNREILTEAWHHIAYVIDEMNQEVRIYLNGSLAATHTIEGTPLFMKADQELHIGNSYEAEEFMVGLIDEVVLYNRALSDAEVAGLAGRTMPIYIPF